jgi:hypothetical protein
MGPQPPFQTRYSTNTQPPAWLIVAVISARPTKPEQRESLFQNDSVALVCLEMQAGRMTVIHHGVTDRQAISLISTVLPDLRHQYLAAQFYQGPLAKRCCTIGRAWSWRRMGRTRIAGAVARASLRRTVRPCEASPEAATAAGQRRCSSSRHSAQPGESGRPG